jgi:hypothetical protein
MLIPFFRVIWWKIGFYIAVIANMFTPTVKVNMPIVSILTLSNVNPLAILEVPTPKLVRRRCNTL